MITESWKKIRLQGSGQLGIALSAAVLGVAILSSLGLAGTGWSQSSGQSWETMSTAHWLGTNRLGQDILDRAVYSTATALKTGCLVSLAATVLGAILGALAGWAPHRWPDHIIVWLMGVLDSVPFYLFAAALAFALGGTTLAMYLAMIATFWTSTARLIRGEVMRLRGQDFILSARAIGLADWLIIWRHVLPNTSHILLVQATLTLVAAIKTEVILSFLGIGIQDGVSWGLMLAEATQDVLAGHFGNFIAASGLLFVTLLGFNLLADAMQDAMDVRGIQS